MHEALRQRVACPEAMKPEAYDRTLKARAFDVARYLLPLATNTSLGQIVNARTLETQVSRLLSHPLAEVRDLGAKLRDAATGPAWNVNARAAADFVQKLKAAEGSYQGTTSVVPQISSDDKGALAPEGSLAAEAGNLLTREVRTAPTLVKYAEPNQYLIQTRAELESAAAELLKGTSPAPSPVVDLVERTESLEVELAATLIYWASHHPYRQVRDIAAGLPASRVSEIIELCCATGAVTTKLFASSTQVRPFASTSSWTSADSVTCIATVASRRSSRDSPCFTAMKRRTRATLPDSKKPVCWLTTRPPSNQHMSPAQKLPQAQARGEIVSTLPAAARDPRPLPFQNGLR